MEYGAGDDAKRRASGGEEGRKEGQHDDRVKLRSVAFDDGKAESFESFAEQYGSGQSPNAYEGEVETEVLDDAEGEEGKERGTCPYPTPPVEEGLRREREQEEEELEEGEEEEEEPEEGEIVEDGTADAPSSRGTQLEQRTWVAEQETETEEVDAALFVEDGEEESEDDIDYVLRCPSPSDDGSDDEGLWTPPPRSSRPSSLFLPLPSFPSSLTSTSHPTSQPSTSHHPAPPPAISSSAALPLSSLAMDAAPLPPRKMERWERENSGDASDPLHRAMSWGKDWEARNEELRREWLRGGKA